MDTLYPKLWKLEFINKLIVEYFLIRLTLPLTAERSAGVRFDAFEIYTLIPVNYNAN